MLHLYHDETPSDVEPVCPTHGCPLYPARPIPCPMCAEEADEMYADSDWRDDGEPIEKQGDKP